MGKELVWTEDFSNLEAWNWDDLIVSAEHRTRSGGLDPVTGELDPAQPWNKVPMRYAALYTAEHRDKCQYIENNQLVMQAFVEKKPNLFRDNFTDQYGVLHAYGDHTIHGGWLSSKRTFKPGCILSVRVNLEEQCMRAHRFSIWLVATNGKMYKKTVEFCEIDLLEAEDAPNVSGYAFGNMGLMKIVGGGAGDTPNGLVDFAPLKINIRKGWHTISLVWHKSGKLEFLCDDVVCNVDDRTMRNPPDGVTMEARLILSDEMCSGVKHLSKTKLATFNERVGLSEQDYIYTVQGLDAFIEKQDPLTTEGAYNLVAVGQVRNKWENYTTGPKMPEDSGLFGQSVVQDIEHWEKHKVRVDWVTEERIVEGEATKESHELQLAELRDVITELRRQLRDVKQSLIDLLEDL